VTNAVTVGPRATGMIGRLRPIGAVPPRSRSR
jgi:hypothetical protein